MREQKKVKVSYEDAIIHVRFLHYPFVLLRFFFSSRRRHTRFKCDWSSDVCSSDLAGQVSLGVEEVALVRSLEIGGIDRSGEVGDEHRSEERRVGKECRSRWSPY